MRRGVATTVAAAAALAACGNADNAGTARPTSLPSTHMVTLPTTSTTPAPMTTAGLQPEHEYVIEEGDLPITIAQKFNVTLDALVVANQWIIEGQYVTNFPPVGTQIRIPAGGTLAGESPPETTLVPGAGAAATSTSSGCGPTEYVIAAGDYPLSVARQFDTSVTALAAANDETGGYASFAVGLVIKIPPRAGC